MNFIVYKLNLINVDEILDIWMEGVSTVIRYKTNGLKLFIGADSYKDAEIQTNEIIDLIGKHTQVIIPKS